MSSSLLVLFTICVGLSVAQTVAEDNLGGFNYQPSEQKYPECGPNEVLNTCVNCPGEETCYDRGQTACLAVFSPCYPDCECKEGYIRKTRGRECIPKEECGEPCDVFQEYTECIQCANHTCSSIKNPVKCDGTEKCTPGCVCWDGYYKDENDKDEQSLCLHRCSCPVLKDTEECSYWNTPHG